MKTGLLLLGAVVFVALASAGVGFVSSAPPTSMAIVSDAEAATLYGGGCQAASNAGCGGNDKGCSSKHGDKLRKKPGSWQQDGDNVNCGVRECGHVIETKSCEE